MKRFFLFAVCCSLLFSLSNCRKGDIGPAGATGPTGASGLTGPTGPKGDTGTANVIYSPWANLTFTGSGSFWSAQIVAPGITQEILDKGVVKTYFKFGTNVYEGNYSNIPFGNSIYQYFNVGLITLKATFAANYPWRYVIIPGGVSTGRFMDDSDVLVLKDGTTISKATLDHMSYEDICRRFNIPQ